MCRHGRFRVIAIAALVIAAGSLLPQIRRATDALFLLAYSQWNLDVERAMDAIGLAPGMVVGEAGAGDGYFTIPMARRVGAGGAVYANDINRRALGSRERRAGREGLTNVQTVVGEVDDPLFPRRDLELVVLVHAFHDFARPVEWLTNAKKYLRPGARLAVIDRDPAQGAGRHFWSRERIEGYAGEAGYELVKAEDGISDHLILVFRLASSLRFRIDLDERSGGRRRRREVDLVARDQPIGQPLQRRFVRPREERLHRGSHEGAGLALLHRRPRPVGASRDVAAPEPEVPAKEFPGARHSVAVFSPVLERERHVPSVY
ncbi:MAG: methyltransferase domain-containing protein [Acidobacteria bacterium]|nr:MAG: methyltransferase domain-containing protein [Acidobacteriota bacterium]